ncbi:MAG: pyridoxamine 5'-phosphate oxidase [Puniceicoccaceae bacterium]
MKGETSSVDLGALRRDYTQGGLSQEDLPEHPLELFRLWFTQAQEAGITEPNAMVLATVGANGQPSQRTVLLKAFDERGFVFFTNYESRKSQEIGINPRVHLLFPWVDLERQVGIEGTAERISRTDSLKYFLSRPFGSRLGAWVSQQSSVITSRSLLEMKLAEMKRKFADGEVPLPDFWGGYRVVGESFEFWQGRQNRLHDRFVYQRSTAGWEAQRLSP